MTEIQGAKCQPFARTTQEKKILQYFYKFPKPDPLFQNWERKATALYIMIMTGMLIMSSFFPSMPPLHQNEKIAVLFDRQSHSLISLQLGFPNQKLPGSSSCGEENKEFQ